MNQNEYLELAQKSIAGELISNPLALQILTSPDIEILPLLNAAYQVRQTFRGKSVTIHIINNGQNGHCPEDCHYCAQAKSSKADIEEYPLKSDDEFMAEAKHAYEKGAFRYCMVFAGRGPSTGRVDRLSNLIKTIKSEYPSLEICVSTGLLDYEKANRLKAAGLDRLNHNLNTSEKHYGNICTTHTYQDRLNTLDAARRAGIQLCSGVIVGMNEFHQDIIEVACSLRKLNVESIPVNFLMPIPGAKLDKQPMLTPDYCLRVLCLYRFINPKVELRMAAGREIHLRGMEVMGLYAADSLFLDGYLNMKGSERRRTLQMIKDAGFIIKSDFSIDDVLETENDYPRLSPQDLANQNMLKGLAELRPQLKIKSCS
ncbi:MAG: biotin synthase BioB [Candidatus Omnitrophica bacterium]|nr:biotin synthase BioB [Candidatus Omnitrophota bacterium]